MLRLGRCRLDLAIETVMMIDSLDMDDAGRAAIVERAPQRGRDARSSSRTAPTRWSRPRARSRRRALDEKTIVLTGAMVPYAFGSSDGLFNLGSALSFVQVLPPGVYVAMNGQHFPWNGVREEPRTGCFRSRYELPRSHRLEAAVGRHDDLHRDVAARGRPRRDQPVAGISGLRLRSGAGRRRRAAHARGAQPVRADAGRAALREAIAAKYARLHGAAYDPDTEVTVTSGGTEAIFDAGRACCIPGDEVIVLEPCYDSYVPAIELSGGDPGHRAAALPGLRRRLGPRCAPRSRRGRGSSSSTRRTIPPAPC